MSAREPMDWDAYRRAQQRQVTASMVEDFKRRDKIRRQRLEDALAAMKPKPSVRAPEEIAQLCAGREVRRPCRPRPPRSIRSLTSMTPTVRETLGVSRGRSDKSPLRILVMLVTFGVLRCVSA